MSVKSKEGFRYCRHCYDHLAGRVGVVLREAMERNKWIAQHENDYVVTNSGWKFLNEFGIFKEDFHSSNRSFARICMDNTEKQPHIAGQLGARLMKEMMIKKWIQQVPDSREITFTPVGKKNFVAAFHINLESV